MPALRWRRVASDSQPEFVFQVGGTLTVKGNSLWVQWRASGNKLYVKSKGSKEFEYELTSTERPYTLTSDEPEVSHMRFVEIE